MFHRRQSVPRQRPDSIRPRGTKGVFSYYSTPKSNVRPGNRMEKAIDNIEVGSKARSLPVLVALSVIILSILASLTVSIRPSVSFVKGQTALYRSQSDYENAAQNILSRKLSNQTKLTINTGNVEEELVNSYPELAAAAFRLPVIGRRANLVLELRLPAIILTTTSKAYILDDSGLIVSDLQSLAVEARSGLPVVLDQGGLDLKVGDQAVTSETVRFIQAITAQLQAQNLVASQLTLPASANQLDIILKDTPYYIKTDLSGDARVQLGSYLAVKGRLLKDNITPAEYIDVRVEEKVFYK
ncbi:hypothetical protein H0V99_01100 [Candidatus Saccharibacteria bacterium]|nr:hypothetical protein [Candidatus Saccharibacteria bacterium]